MVAESTSYLKRTLVYKLGNPPALATSYDDERYTTYIDPSITRASGGALDDKGFGKKCASSIRRRYSDQICTQGVLQSKEYQVNSDFWY